MSGEKCLCKVVLVIDSDYWSTVWLQIGKVNVVSAWKTSTLTMLLEAYHASTYFTQTASIPGSSWYVWFRFLNIY